MQAADNHLQRWVGSQVKIIKMKDNKIKIIVLIMTHSIAPVNLHSSPITLLCALADQPDTAWLAVQK